MVFCLQNLVLNASLYHINASKVSDIVDIQLYVSMQKWNKKNSLQMYYFQYIIILSIMKHFQNVNYLLNFLFIYNYIIRQKVRQMPIYGYVY